MDARQIRKLGPMLTKYLSEFDDCFSRSEPAGNLRVYVRGQLSDLPRKSIEPMADRAGVPPRTLQQFLSRAAWDDEWMADRLAEIVARDHPHPMSIGLFDDTGDPKKGDKTPGVQRQWCGATGGGSAVGEPIMMKSLILLVVALCMVSGCQAQVKCVRVVIEPNHHYTIDGQRVNDHQTDNGSKLIEVLEAGA